MASETIDIEAKITELNSKEAKGELRAGDEVITWYMPLFNFCRTLVISEKDSEEVKELISTELNGTSRSLTLAHTLTLVKELISTELNGTLKAKVDKWAVPHYVIETNNFVFFLPKKDKQNRNETCVYPFIKSSHFEHKKDYRPDIKLETFQKLTSAAAKALKERSIEREKTERKWGIKTKLTQILKLFDKNEIDSALKYYDILLKTSLVRGNLSIGKFKMLYNTSKTAKEMGASIKAILWLILYKMKKKVSDNVP